MAYKYQPIKDEMFVSDGEGDDEEVEGLEEDGETILSTIQGENGEEWQ